MIIIDKNGDLNSPRLVDLAFKRRIDNDLEYLGFCNQRQSGFFFFLAATLNVNIQTTSIDVRPYFTEKLYKENFNRVLNLYSSGFGDFEDHTDLKESDFSQVIYTANHILHKILLNQDIDIDKNLRKITNDHFVGKTELNQIFVSKFKDSTFNLANVHAFFDQFFYHLGEHLERNLYVTENAYDAGFAYANRMFTKDPDGTWYLFQSLVKSLSPIFKALLQYPLLHTFMPEAFKSNHLFSATLQTLLNGLQLNEPMSHIYQFHQWLMYEPGTVDLRKVWDFNTDDKNHIVVSLYLNTYSLRQTNMFELRNQFIKSDQVFMRELTDLDLTKDNLFNAVLSVLVRKYGYNAFEQKWLNTADFLQCCTCLLYETGMHVMLPKKITDD